MLKYEKKLASNCVQLKRKILFEKEKKSMWKWKDDHYVKYQRVGTTRTGDKDVIKQRIFETEENYRD